MEIRLYEGPNVYRLLPVVKVEVAVGRTRAWHGSRSPGDGALVHLARPVPLREWPDDVADLVAWTRRLRADHGEHGGPVEVHRAVGRRPLDRHLAVDRRRADPADRARPPSTSPAGPCRRPGACG